MFSVRRGLLAVAIAVAYLLVGAGPDAQAQQGGGAAAAGAFFDMMARMRGQGGYSPAGPYSPEPLGQGPGTQGLLIQAGFFGGGSEAENPQAMWQQEQRDLKEGRLREAIALAERLLVIVRSRLGENNPDTYRMLGNLAMLYATVSRFSEAETMHARAIHGLETTLGANHPNTRLELGNLAWLYNETGRYREAEATYKRALAGAESVTAAKDEFTLRSYFGLGTVYARQGRYREAEDLIKQALLTSERALGKEHSATIDAVNGLQVVYEYEGRFDESQALLLRALAASERVRGKNHPATVLLVYNLSLHYFHRGKYDLAEPHAKRALAAIERILGKDDYRYANALENLALLYVKTGRLKEAEPLHLQALEIAGRVIGKDTYITLSIVNQLAENYMQQGRFAEADTLFQRVRLSETARMVGMEHPGAIDNLGDLGELNFAQGNNRQAVEYWRRSTGAAIQRTERRADNTGQALTGNSRTETQRVSRQFQGLVKAAYRLTSEGKEPDAALAGEMFQTAQWAIRSEAAQSLAQMAARGAAGNQTLANLVRDRQDLMTKWLAHDKQRNEALSQPPAQRNSQGEAENQAALTALGKRIADIDRRLAQEYPDYSSLANPMPLTVEEVQAQLGPDEALMFFFDTQELKPAPEETFVWAITRNEARWVRAGLGTAAIAREVQALRCGLDAAAWSTADCAGLTGQTYNPSDELGIFALPFDQPRAHRLYKTLFGQVEDVVKGKQLQIVPSGALTQLPFQVLLTAAPSSADHRSAAWLIREHALTVLPAVSSLKALRRLAQASAATKPMIGFGNPLLEGDKNDPSDRDAAARALNSQACSPQLLADYGLDLGGGPVRSATAVRGVRPVSMRRGVADTQQIRYAPPLPETSGELCAVARDLGADPSEIRLGARATETEVKRLSASGELAQYRVVHFATHGALAGDVAGSSEPGLILTPPSVPGAEDDGYLTASEVATLKLDADWVILSACNTAAGGAKDAEALSGLARAFIYAQARALLVSHWSVNSGATVKLVTGAISRLGGSRGVGRAEAMRESMLALIDKGQPYEAHPAYWAPFVVVGEGGAGR